MSLPRRPLFISILAFCGGIANVYIFSPELWSIIALFALAVLLLAILYISSKRINPLYLKIVFPLLLAAIFFASSLYTIYSFGETDPLSPPPIKTVDETSSGSTEALSSKSQDDVIADITGRVMKIQQRKVDYYLLTVNVSGRNILLRIFSDITEDPQTEPSNIMGKVINFRAKTQVPDTARNPRCFDYRLHLLSQDIRIIATAEPAGISIAGGGSTVGNLLGSFYNHLYRLKAKFMDIIGENMSQENAALMNGMLFGDKSLIDEDVYEGFQKNGIAHILSVSGLHVAMVYAFISRFFSGRRTRLVYIIIILFLIIYAALAEFSPSVVRAVIMISVHAVSKIAFRKYDFVTSISLSALLILLCNPLELFGVGFQLSFIAVISLGFALPFSEKFVGYRWKLTGQKLSQNEVDIFSAGSHLTALGRKLSMMFMPILIIQLFMMPITIYAFNYISISALLLNAPIIFLAGIIVPLGIIILLASELILLCPALEAALSLVPRLIGEAAEILLNAMSLLSDIGTDIPFSSFMMDAPNPSIVISIYCISFFLMSETFVVLRARRKSLAIFLSCILLASVGLLTLHSPVTAQDHASLTFVDVGQGDCLHIRTADGKNYLVDGGGSADYNIGKNTILPYLLKNGVRKLDGVFLSHLHMDHFKGITELAQNMDIGSVYTYDGNSVRTGDITEEIRDDDEVPKHTKNTLGISHENLRFVSKGDRVILGSGAQADILYPPKGTEDEYLRSVLIGEDENKSSLLIRITVSGISVLMTGDIGFDGEKAATALLKSKDELNADVLKIGHHGSKTSTSDEFLRAVSPKVSVIQVGTNNYGHPTREVLDKLGGAGIITYRNDSDGAVMMDKASGGIEVRTVNTSFISPALAGKYY